MAITSGICVSFKAEMLQAKHDLLHNTIMIALFTRAARLDRTRQVYRNANEASGTGYTAGGLTLTNVRIQTGGSVAFVTWDDAVWSNRTITARGALIYNARASNRAIAVIDFGIDKSRSNDRFTVQFPTDDRSHAILCFN